MTSATYGTASQSLTATIQKICTQNASFAASYKAARETLATFSSEGSFSRSDVAGKLLLDWECGIGAYCALFLELGAGEVTGIDSFLDQSHVDTQLRELPAHFERSPIQQFAADPKRHGHYDVIFTNTVTEHLPNLASALTLCFQLLQPSGILLLNHDNYYQPVGSHDHGFLFYGDRSQVVFQGVRCWDAVEKCVRSEGHRKSMIERLPWTWDATIDSRLTPEDCRKCPYYRRAQPWAHLLNHSEFRNVFPQVSFTTGYAKSSLNKVTPFQLRQFLIEAGFDIERWVPHVINNEPPDELLKPPFNLTRQDLCSSTITVRCRKAMNPYS